VPVNFQKKNIINTMIFLTVLSSIIIYAKEGGIIGRTQKNGFGCTCHSESPTIGVLVAITGPDTLTVGQSATYTVTIQGGPLVAGGTNIAASNGNLLAIAGDLRKESDELTHVTPKTPSAGKVTFQFSYTAPSVVGQQTLFANGNSVNFNGENTGDEWNFATNKIINVVQPTGIEDQISANSFELSQNYPNPFNPSTRIQYQVSSNAQVLLQVYDALGNEVGTLVNGWKEAGNHSVNFDASGLSSGIYYYKLSADNFVETKKMIVLR
jgi:hypothetical protein